jgi:hypothetical protein
MIPSRFRITRMITITSKVWTAFPERGNPEKTLGPKKPSNHKMSRTMMIVLSMRFLLLGGLGSTGIIQETLPRHILQPGSVILRQLGEQVIFFDY